MRSPGLVRVGTRGSALALAQTELTIAALRAAHPETTYEPAIIRTQGDRDKVTPLTMIGGQGVFTVALQDALLRGEVDIAVHSAKDLPSATPDGLVLAAFPERADPRDVFISRRGVGLGELAPGTRVGTSSRRRAVQAQAINPYIEIIELRGNLDTRLRKSTEPEYDGIIVAAAGLDRMGWQERITEYLPVDRFVPSPGQGALAIECRADDAEMISLLAQIDHAPTRIAVTAERAALGTIGAGCRMPFAAYARVTEDGVLHEMYGMLADEDGTNLRRLKIDTNEGHNLMGDPIEAGRMLAEQLSSGLPLHGLRVLVTRPEGQADAIIERLEALGATVLHAPTIRIADPPSYSALDAALRHLPCYDWVVWTSGNGVTRTFARLEALGLDPNTLRSCKLAVIGGSTARVLSSFGYTADLVPPQAVAESLRDALIAAGVDASSYLLLPQPVQSRDVLAMGLRAAGATVDVVPVYQTELNADMLADLRECLATDGFDCALVTSPSTVHGLLALLDHDVENLRRIPFACIGPVTADAVRALGIEPVLVATEHTNDGLVTALIDHWTGVHA